MLELAVRIGRHTGKVPAHQVAQTLQELQKIGRSLHIIYERQCNKPMMPEVEARVENRRNALQEKAWDLALYLGCAAYHQTDPRGCAIYLWPLLPEEAAMVRQDYSPRINMDTFQRAHQSDYTHGQAIPLK